MDGEFTYSDWGYEEYDSIYPSYFPTPCIYLYTSFVHSYSARPTSQNNDIHNGWRAERSVLQASRSVVSTFESYGSCDSGHGTA